MGVCKPKTTRGFLGEVLVWGGGGVDPAVEAVSTDGKRGVPYREAFYKQGPAP